MVNVWFIICREFSSFFVMLVVYVFIVIFLMLLGVFIFFIGNLYECGQVDFILFFNFYFWLYLFLVLVMVMCSWVEECKFGLIELLMMLFVSIGEVVLGKFLVVWFIFVFLFILIFFLWLSVNYFG